MEAKRFNFRKKITLQSAVCLILLYNSGCGSNANVPQVLDENKVAQISRIWRTDTNEDITENIVVKQGEGFYMVIEIEAVKDHPEEVDGRVVTNPTYWPCVAVAYPKGESSTSKDAIRFMVGSLSVNNSTEFHTPALAPPGPHMKPPAYQGSLTLKKKPEQMRKSSYSSYSSGPPPAPGEKPPAPPPVLDHKFAEGVVPMWTFVGAVFDEPGDYTLELLVYPFWAGRVGDHIGDAVSVYQGTLKITE